MKNLNKIIMLAAVVGIVGTTGAVYAATVKTPAEIVSGLTGKTVEQLTSERELGKTYGTIANEAGMLDEFKSQMLEQRKAVLDERVKAGTLTQAQADEIYNSIKENQANCDASGNGIGMRNGVGCCGLGSGKSMGNETLEGLVECGRLAPSGHNKQGRSFLVLTDRSTIDEVGGIGTWSKFVIGKAPALILVFCDNQECATPVEGGSAATENILIAATAQGLGSCWMAGYGMPFAEEIETFVGASKNRKLISVIALGYPADTNTPMPKKSSLDEVIFWNKF